MESAIEDLLISRCDAVLVVTLNRPAVRNALRTQTLREIATILTDSDADESIRCVVLNGNEQAFAAGADVSEIAGKSSADAASDPRKEYWAAIRSFSKPIVAAVRGFCLGGGNELVMLCDVIIASETARFAQPEIKLGLMPGAGGTQRLTAAIGKPRAMKMLLTGDVIGGRQAFEAGLVSECVPDDQVEAHAMEVASVLAAMPAQAAREIKRAVLAASDGLLKASLLAEREAFESLLATEDFREGVAAFLEKRKPEFKGR